jgi:hypothetical protein
MSRAGDEPCRGAGVTWPSDLSVCGQYFKKYCSNLERNCSCQIARGALPNVGQTRPAETNASVTHVLIWLDCEKYQSFQGTLQCGGRQNTRNHAVNTHATMNHVDSAPQRAVGRDAVQSFEYIFGSYSTVRQLIMKYGNNSHALRQVSRALQAALNHDVSTIACDLTAPRFEADMVTVFPAANKLRVSGAYRYEAELDVCILLEYILATSPALVTKLLALRLSLGIIHSFEDIIPAVAGFLARYGKVFSSSPVPSYILRPLKRSFCTLLERW